MVPQVGTHQYNVQPKLGFMTLLTLFILCTSATRIRYRHQQSERIRIRSINIPIERHQNSRLTTGQAALVRPGNLMNRYVICPVVARFTGQSTHRILLVFSIASHSSSEHNQNKPLRTFIAISSIVAYQYQSNERHPQPRDVTTEINLSHGHRIAHQCC